jgi:hypothetical protein
MDNVAIAATETPATPATQTAPETITPSPEQIAWKQQMDAAFMDTLPLPTQQTQSPEATDNTATQSTTPITSTVDYTPFVKENFGVDTVDEVKAQWAELQALKANPPVPKEIEFANEESKKVHELIRQ